MGSHSLGVKIGRAMRITDGFITFDAADYSPETTKAVKQWFAETSRKAYYAGPLTPQNREDISNGREVLTFLDERLTSPGEKSVIYVTIDFAAPDRS